MRVRVSFRGLQCRAAFCGARRSPYGCYALRRRRARQRKRFEEIKILTPAPTREVPFTTGRELGVGAAMDLGSPALSASVFRLGSGSPTTTIINKLQQQPDARASLT